MQTVYRGCMALSFELRTNAWTIPPRSAVLWSILFTSIRARLRCTAMALAGGHGIPSNSCPLHFSSTESEPGTLILIRTCVAREPRQPNNPRRRGSFRADTGFYLRVVPPAACQKPAYRAAGQSECGHASGWRTLRESPDYVQDFLRSAALEQIAIGGSK